MQNAETKIVSVLAVAPSLAMSSQYILLEYSAIGLERLLGLSLQKPSKAAERKPQDEILGVVRRHASWPLPLSIGSMVCFTVEVTQPIDEIDNNKFLLCLVTLIWVTVVM